MPLGVLRYSVRIVIGATERIDRAAIAVAIAIREQDFASFDSRMKVEVVRLDTGSAFRNQEVREDQPGTLVFIDEIKKLGMVWNRSNWWKAPR